MLVDEVLEVWSSDPDDLRREEDDDRRDIRRAVSCRVSRVVTFFIYFQMW